MVLTLLEFLHRVGATGKGILAAVLEFLHWVCATGKGILAISSRSDRHRGQVPVCAVWTLSPPTVPPTEGPHGDSLSKGADDALTLKQGGSGSRHQKMSGFGVMWYVEC